jgi:predicted transcriptional regulator of viral defense system
MTFREFETAFDGFPVIPIVEIHKAFPGFDRNALTRWQKKGYLQKIRQGYYRVSKSVLVSDPDHFLVANRIYPPSYISLQSALRWYDFIPEGVFTFTSITTRKPVLFHTPLGDFRYQNLKRSLFFGYRMQECKGHYFKIAEPEKALLDYLYLHPHLNHPDELFELRLNTWEIKERVDWEKMEQYLSLFNSKTLTSRVQTLEQHLQSYDVHP